MPVITLHVAEASAPQVALERLVDEVRQVCQNQLRARPDAIQINLVHNTRVLFGQPVYVEVFYRDQPYRDAAAMAALMGVLETQVQAAWAVKPRIRCMAIRETDLHALN